MVWMQSICCAELQNRRRGRTTFSVSSGPADRPDFVEPPVDTKKTIKPARGNTIAVRGDTTDQEPAAGFKWCVFLWTLSCKLMQVVFRGKNGKEVDRGHSLLLEKGTHTYS